MGINNATGDGKWCLGWNVKVFAGIIDVNFDEISILGKKKLKVLLVKAFVLATKFVYI